MVIKYFIFRCLEKLSKTTVVSSRTTIIIIPGLPLSPFWLKEQHSVSQCLCLRKLLIILNMLSNRIMCSNMLKNYRDSLLHTKYTLWTVQLSIQHSLVVWNENKQGFLSKRKFTDRLPSYLCLCTLFSFIHVFQT